MQAYFVPVWRIFPGNGAGRFLISAGGQTGSVKAGSTAVPVCHPFSGKRRNVVCRMACPEIFFFDLCLPVSFVMTAQMSCPGRVCRKIIPSGCFSSGVICRTAGKSGLTGAVINRRGIHDPAGQIGAGGNGTLERAIGNRSRQSGRQVRGAKPALFSLWKIGGTTRSRQVYGLFLSDDFRWGRYGLHRFLMGYTVRRPLACMAETMMKMPVWRFV